MNKRSRALLSIIVIVLVVFYILNRNNVSTLNNNESSFEFKQTEKIDKIFLSNKYTRQYVILKKVSDKDWTVNDSFKASPYQLEILMDGLKKIRVKRPVSKNELVFVKKDIALNGTKVEIYENGSLAKVFYVGGNTIDELGTYCLIENAQEPYVCHIPGFNGFLSARFFTQRDGWRSKSIFAIKDQDIKQINVQWTAEPNNSFSIDNSGKEPLLYVNNMVLKNNIEINLNNLKTYLKLWENLSFEGFPIDLNPHKIDSIAHTQPLLTLTVTSKSNVKTTLRIHKKGIKRDSNIQFDDQGNPLQFDIETYYAFINDNNKEVVQIQDYIFGKVMKQAKDFAFKR